MRPSGCRYFWWLPRVPIKRNPASSIILINSALFTKRKYTRECGLSTLRKNLWRVKFCLEILWVGLCEGPSAVGGSRLFFKKQHMTWYKKIRRLLKSSYQSRLLPLWCQAAQHLWVIIADTGGGT